MFKTHGKGSDIAMGACAGAFALAVLGFTWGGWHTTGAVEKREAIAAIRALTPVCIENFKKAPDAKAKLIALKAIGSIWQRETFVKEGKWAMVGDDLNSRVVDACAEALFTLKQ
jgi:hypothetical protein